MRSLELLLPLVHGAASRENQEQLPQISALVTTMEKRLRKP
jgi:hypothetical protein